MPRKCELTGKHVLFGNNVSHAKNRTRRVFRPNLSRVTMRSDVLGRKFRVKSSASGLRTVDHVGGFDAYLLKVKSEVLSPEMRRVQAEVKSAITARLQVMADTVAG